MIPGYLGLEVLEQLAKRRSLRIDGTFATGVGRRIVGSFTRAIPNVLSSRSSARRDPVLGLGAWPGVSPQNAS